MIVSEEEQNYTVTIDNAAVPDPSNQLRILWPFIGVPMRPHWVVSDTTDPIGPWNPRRPDWAPALLMGQTGDTSTLSPDDALGPSERRDRSTDRQADAREIKTILTTKVPVGLWETEAGVQFRGHSHGGQLPG